jgi:hypothetical protein
MEFYGQALQDKFVLNVSEFKRDGTFLEIGSNHPMTINNTYTLERGFGWRGIMVEYDRSWEHEYKKHRPGSVHIMADATQVDYVNALKNANMPNNIDYLQIDLEVNNGSTLKTLQKIDEEVFNLYNFGIVTFEHDIYHTNFMNTREESRKIFHNRGYLRVFSDITNNGKNPFEDWYVHPSIVNMDYVLRLMEENEIDNTNSRNINYNI